uniref:Vomeronasal type-1 receptor n=1 Tax=Globodera rostochiensis TaxID=31243 RepID=A0A914IET2_GLORO
MGERFVRWDAVVRNFLFVDSMVYSFTGLCLIIAPHHIAQLIMKRHVTDGVHWHLLRCIGGQFLATACLTWRCTSAARSSLHSTCLLLRLLASMLSAFVFAHNQAMHAEFVETAIIRLLVWLFVANSAACLLLLLVNGWPKYERIGIISRWGNIFCQLDSVMAIMIGFGWAFSPLWLLHRQVLVLLDPSHQLCGQIIGVNFLTSYIISTYALNCGRREAFQMAAETRLIMIFYINLAQFWSQFFYHEHWSNKHFAGISVFITWTSIALVYRIYLWFAGNENEVVMAIAQNGTTLANGSATHYYKKRT